jgi:hypothetical protein
MNDQPRTDERYANVLTLILQRGGLRRCQREDAV